MLPLLAGCTATVEPEPAPSVAPASSARALLDGLRVQGRGPLTGYDREAFGPAWADADRNGCDTRNDVLRRDLSDVVLKPGTRGCVVLSGRLTDPYTGAQVPHVRGGGAVEIDHVVALADAWQKGAAGWTAERRLAFANDPLELQAVATPVNRAKGGGDAATWVPPGEGGPLRVRRPPGRRQGAVRPRRHPGRARRPGPPAGPLPRRAGAGRGPAAARTRPVAA